MKRLFTHRYVLTALRLILGGIFIYAGSISVRSPEQFADSVAGYRLLPSELINIFAVSLPPFELLAGVLLIIGRPRRIALFSALVLTAVFAIALSSAIARGLTIDCGCFGHGTPSRSGMWVSLGRDLVMGLLLFVLYRHEWNAAKAGELPA